jgi:PmbA protein
VSHRSLADIAELLLDAAARHGATAADVVVAEGDSLSTGVRLGKVEKVQRSRGKHLGLRVFAGERSAIVSTADFSEASLATLAADAVELARVTAPDPAGGLPLPGELATTIPDLDLDDPALAEVSAEQATEWCEEAEAAALGADPRITNSEGAEFDAGGHQIVYAASNGFRGAYRSSSCSLSVAPVASQNGSMQRDHWYDVKRHLGRLENPAAIGRRAAERTLRRLGARQVPTREVAVVFDPDMAASLLGHLAGAVAGNALYRKTSFLLGKLGERIAPAHVSVFDDGTLRAGLGSKPFDGEGLATRRTAVVEEGILASYLLDCYSARKLGGKSTGNAARSVADAPHASPTNLFLAAGSSSPEEIIASVRSGFYVTSLMGFGVNPVTGDYSRGASGLWIEDGELAYPVEEVTIAGNLLRMFEEIEAVGSDLELRHGISAPTIKIARLTVAGQ